MADQMFTWDALQSMATASLATFLFVGVTKSLVDRITPWFPTDLYASFIAFIIVLLTQLALGANGSDWRVYVLSILNGLLVWATAGKIQNIATVPPKNKEVKK